MKIEVKTLDDAVAVLTAYERGYFHGYYEGTHPNKETEK